MGFLKNIISDMNRVSDVLSEAPVAAMKVEDVSNYAVADKNYGIKESENGDLLGGGHGDINTIKNKKLYSSKVDSDGFYEDVNNNINYENKNDYYRSLKNDSYLENIDGDKNKFYDNEIKFPIRNDFDQSSDLESDVGDKNKEGDIGGQNKGKINSPDYENKFSVQDEFQVNEFTGISIDDSKNNPPLSSDVRKINIDGNEILESSSYRKCGLNIDINNPDNDVSLKDDNSYLIVENNEFRKEDIVSSKKTGNNDEVFVDNEKEKIELSDKIELSNKDELSKNDKYIGYDNKIIHKKPIINYKNKLLSEKKSSSNELFDNGILVNNKCNAIEFDKKYNQIYEEKNTDTVFYKHNNKSLKIKNKSISLGDLSSLESKTNVDRLKNKPEIKQNERRLVERNKAKIKQSRKKLSNKVPKNISKNVSNNNSRDTPQVIIGQIDIKVEAEAAPEPTVQQGSPNPMSDLSSRYYLRRL